MTPSLRAVIGASVASGLAAFSVTALVGDVATTLGGPAAGVGVEAQIGLTGTTLGVALGVIRLASLGALPMASLGDRLGRRGTLLGVLSAGLGLTVLGAAAPAFWWWVAAVALARPFLSTANAIAGVVAAEETTSRYRGWALMVIGGSYGLGAGIVPVLRGIFPDLSFRAVLAFVIIPLLLVPLLARHLHEPSVYARAHEVAPPPALPGAVPAEYRGRLVLLLLATVALSLATGPGFTFVVVYAEDILGASTATTAALVLGAGPAGLAGLLLGRWLGDRVGRRPTMAVSLVATAVAVGMAYSGAIDRLAVGYLLAIATAATFGTPAAALAAEAFPTPARATVAGWVTAAGVTGAVAGLAAFGVLADLTGGFADAARILAFVVALGALPLAGLPETRGQELTADETAPV